MNTEDLYFSGCEIGFVGSGSDCVPCRFLYYGYGCQIKCDCLEKDCHHVYGCKNVSAGNVLMIKNTMDFTCVPCAHVSD